MYVKIWRLDLEMREGKWPRHNIHSPSRIFISPLCEYISRNNWYWWSLRWELSWGDDSEECSHMMWMVMYNDTLPIPSPFLDGDGLISVTATSSSRPERWITKDRVADIWNKTWSWRLTIPVLIHIFELAWEDRMTTESFQSSTSSDFGETGGAACRYRRPTVTRPTIGSELLAGWTWIFWITSHLSMIFERRKTKRINVCLTKNGLMR